MQFHATKSDVKTIDHMVPAVGLALAMGSAICLATIHAAVKTSGEAASLVFVLGAVQFYALVRFIAAFGLLLRIRLSITMSEPEPTAPPSDSEGKGES